jgi:hypothetical protein
MAPLHAAGSAVGDEGHDAERDDDHRSDAERSEGIRRLKADIAVAKSPELTALEERLYKHVVDCIDFDALFGLEQLLWYAVDQLGHGKLDLDAGLSHRLIQRALTHAAHDPANTFKDVPVGVTKAERRAVRFDPECQFCEYEDEHAVDATPEPEHDHGGDACALCDAMAHEWRTAHADKLRAARDRRVTRTQTTERRPNPKWRKA